MNIAFIFARGGSKGIHKKNLQEVGNITLLEHSVQAAKASQLIDDVIVSTDDPEIREFALGYGAVCPNLRPKELATDHSPELLSWKYAIREYNTRVSVPLKTFISLPTTAPLRSIPLIDRQIERFVSSEADISFSVTPSDTNPYFNMIEKTCDGFSLVKPDMVSFRRQDAPLVYNITTCCYVARPDYILKAENLFDGRIDIFSVPKANAIDIDDELDLAIANYLWDR